MTDTNPQHARVHDWISAREAMTSAISDLTAGQIAAFALWDSPRDRWGVDRADEVDEALDAIIGPTGADWQTAPFEVVGEVRHFALYRRWDSPRDTAAATTALDRAASAVRDVFLAWTAAAVAGDLDPHSQLAEDLGALGAAWGVIVGDTATEQAVVAALRGRAAV